MRKPSICLCVLLVLFLPSLAAAGHVSIPWDVQPVIDQAEAIYLNNVKKLRTAIDSDPATAAVYLGLVLQGQKRHVECNPDLMPSLKRLAKEIEDTLVESVQNQGGTALHAGQKVNAEQVRGMFYAAANGDYNDWVKESLHFDPQMRHHPNILPGAKKKKADGITLLGETPPDPSGGSKWVAPDPTGSKGSNWVDNTPAGEEHPSWGEPSQLEYRHSAEPQQQSGGTPPPAPNLLD